MVRMALVLEDLWFDPTLKYKAAYPSDNIPWLHASHTNTHKTACSHNSLLRPTDRVHAWPLTGRPPGPVDNDIHDWHKMAGEETRKLVWEGKLPVCFCLHPDEVRDVRRDMSLESCYVSLICCTV